MAENQRYHNREYFEVFQSKLSELSAEAALKYRRTLSDLDFFLSGNRLSFQDISYTMVADWATELFRQGFAKTTVVRHLNILSSLVKTASKKGMLAPSDAPRRLVKILDDSAFTLPPLLKDVPFAHSLKLLRRAIGGSAQETDTCMNLLAVSVLGGGVPVESLVGLKKNEVDGFDYLSRKVMERNISANRDYVFDLRQSYHTPRQIYAQVTSALRQAFGAKVAIEDMDADMMARSLWAACAMRSGATASEALAMTGGSAPYAVPAFCEASGSLRAEKPMWVKTVNQLLTSEMPRWYAMHIRKGVSFDTLRVEISEKVRPVPELFYPCETITKFTGSKKTVTDHPVISQTAFFKSHPEGVMPMFALIGDKAWCYRVQNSSSAPYAVISQAEMQRFQAAVGIFSSDVEVHPLGELSPRPGESVVVIMAGYGNREGKVEDVIASDSGSAIFRVKLATDQGYEWRMNVDARQIERVVGR